MQSYDEKSPDYFGNARKEIEPLLPERPARILEIGCGSGATLGWLRHIGRCEQAYGIELFESAAALARARADDVITGDAERLIDGAYPGMQFDAILCLDVLEHMVDPWTFVPKLHRLLAPAGKLVVSLPNVRCIRVSGPLLLKGQWRYAQDGILDRTHLRFFTLEGARELLTTEQLAVRRVIRKLPSPKSKQGILNWITRGAFADLLAPQYLIACSRDPSAGSLQ